MFGNKSNDANTNGGNLSVANTTVHSCGGSGLVWRASSLNVQGCVFERNLGAGVVADTLSADPSLPAYRVIARGATITGNHFEHNHQGQIKLAGRVASPVIGVVIEGNSLTSNYAGTDGATALALAEGDGPGSIRHVRVGMNAYWPTGALLTHDLDFGNQGDKSSLVHVTEPDGSSRGMIGLGACQTN